MSKPITFKRRNVEFTAFFILIALFISVCGFAYYVFFYTPEIINEPYVDPRETNK